MFVAQNARNSMNTGLCHGANAREGPGGGGGVGATDATIAEPVLKDSGTAQTYPLNPKAEGGTFRGSNPARCSRRAAPSAPPLVLDGSTGGGNEKNSPFEP